MHSVNSTKECLLRTADPEHEADLYVGEENVSRTKRVLQSIVDVLVKSSIITIIIIGAVEQPRSRRDHVRSDHCDHFAPSRDHVGSIIQSERGRREEDQETEM